ncbi:MAG: hypothetical protein H6621_03920 [Halobacteriovoraceae bacterium]|nr:hypothetical protein [Halobacteriovoraceae bacterium]
MKKKKFEITAAISEEDYRKKLNVDKILSDDQRDNFYKAPSKNISKVIDDFSETKKKTAGYGHLSLNKQVQTSKDTVKKEERSNLSDFLEEKSNISSVIEKKQVNLNSANESFREDDSSQSFKNISSSSFVQSPEYFIMKQTIENQANDIKILENKLRGLLKDFEELKDAESDISKIQELKNILKSFDLSEGVVKTIIRKAQFELTEDELNNEELLYEVALREISEMIKVQSAKFSQTEFMKKPVITILISENSSGQTSMALKLTAMAPNSVLIKYNMNENHTDFTEKILDIKVENCSDLQRLLGKVREASELGKNIFIDLRAVNSRYDETKKIIASINRSFDNVEILLCLSAIHSEIYNNKVCNKFSDVADGIAVSHLDMCLNLSSLINLQYSNQLPYMFFGTGPRVPQDIEEATVDRLIAEIFKV